MSFSGFHIFSTEARKLLENFLEEKNPKREEFDDSVFIEAQHLATKISENDLKDSFLLDETDAPDLLNDTLNDSKVDIENTKDAVFKKLDLLIPPFSNNLSAKLDNENSNNQNKSDINSDKHISHTHEDSEKSYSDNLLEKFSKIIAKDKIDKNEFQEGEHILDSLAELLKKKYLPKDTQERSGSTQLSAVRMFKTRSTRKTVSLNDLNINKKKGTEPVSRKGPLKALMPVMDLNKKCGKVASSGVSENILKRNSFDRKIENSPIRNSHITPVAQSTPDSHSNFNRNSHAVSADYSCNSIISSGSSTKEQLTPRHNSMLPRKKSLSESEKIMKPMLTRRSNSATHIPNTNLKNASPIKPRFSSFSKQMTEQTSGILRDRSNSSPCIKQNVKMSMNFGSPRILVKSSGKENKF